MVGDRESQLYRDIADLTEQFPKLQQSVESLKEKVNNVESLEIEKQLISLKGSITKLDESLLKTNRFIVEFFIHNMCLFLKSEISKHLKPTNELYIRTREFLIEKEASAITSLKISKTPLKVKDDFHKECAGYFKRNNLPGFKKE